jgi:hypothetical protein
MQQTTRRRPAVAAIAALTLVLNPMVPLVTEAAQVPAAKPPAATQPAGAKPAAAKPAAAKPAAAPAPIDGGWPRAYALPSGASILVYQPQIASWDQQKQLLAFSAVSYRTTASEKPALGTIKLQATTSVAVSDRLVKFTDMKIAEANFGSMAKDQVREITEQIDKAIPDDERVIALDRVLANLDKSTVIAKNVEGVKADPPPIFFSKTPAVIVNIDGDPIMSPIKDNDLKFAVNTNWDLFQHGPSNTNYLLNDGAWLKAADVNGPWSPAGKLPDSFKKLPADDNWKDVKAALPGKTIAASAVPKIFVTTKPGELILLTGEPKYEPVPGTPLLWVSNTDSDVFRLGKTGAVYYLVTGRWFSAPDFTGPWTFATTNLPADFKKIPLEHPRSRVLASVPGTDQAAEAILLAQIPQTARVNKKQVTAPEVAYQGGQPDMQPIEQTTVQRAVNTDKDVFLIGGKYYMCYQGVWFVGGTATGPWEVATSVPQEIYKIPASSSANHVTYVTIEEDDDEWVTFAAAAGYTGMMVAWGCMVWGSGWYYPPYYGFYGGYPYYYGGFHTYGYSAFYNPWTGAYGRSARVYGPYGGAGVGARYNPRTGTYARGAAAYGPYGARGVAQAYNPRTGTYAQTRQGSNVYGSWGSTSVQRGDDWAKTNRYTNNRTGNTTRTIQSSEGNAVVKKGDNGGRVAAGSGGNVYAGKDGSVYRKDSGGTWQKYDNGGWQNTPNQPSGERPTPNDANRTGADRPNAGTNNRTQPSAGTSSIDRSTTDQLNRDASARSEGATRSKDYGNYRSGSGSAGTGSYRGGGGASRSGGGASRGGGGGGGGRRR